jgi:hypothetical protein
MAPLLWLFVFFVANLLCCFFGCPLGHGTAQWRNTKRIGILLILLILSKLAVPPPQKSGTSTAWKMGTKKLDRICRNYRIYRIKSSSHFYYEIREIHEMDSDHVNPEKSC